MKPTITETNRSLVMLAINNAIAYKAKNAVERRCYEFIQDFHYQYSVLVTLVYFGMSSLYQKLRNNLPNQNIILSMLCSQNDDGSFSINLEYDASYSQDTINMIQQCFDNAKKVCFN